MPGLEVTPSTCENENFDLNSLRIGKIDVEAVPLKDLLGKHDFSHVDLIRAIMKPLTRSEIAAYLSTWNQDDVRIKINLKYQNFPPLFYAAQTNDCKLVRLLMEMGARTDVPGGHSVPLLAWIILNDHPQSFNIMATILSMGCSPATIPADIYEHIMRNSEDLVAKEVLPEQKWCTPGLRVALAEHIHLTHKYLLRKASTRKTLSPRKLQAARHLGVSALFEMPYFIVGQDIATNIVCSSVLGHLGVKNFHPLVMAFAGPPGHGKTELARQMGGLLSAEMIVIDCTEMQHETDLFGPKSSYYGSAVGSPLNNHLANEHGKRTVVFLDEFDKTTEEVRQSLLIVFDQGGSAYQFYGLCIPHRCDSGTYRDRRNPSIEYDCSNTIWILATNLGDRVIHAFCDSSSRRSEKLSSMDIEKLSTDIRSAFLTHFRVSCIFPGRTLF